MIKRTSHLKIGLLMSLGACTQNSALAMQSQMVTMNKLSFYLEAPQTAKEYEQGLMHRHHIQAQQGMIFRFKPDNHPIMWMKNTYIPLDMLFIGVDHRIACIVQHARPLSLKLLSCPVPVVAVIELHAGDVKEFHLIKGMTVSW